MRVLVACECSGIVREAFRTRGHDASVASEVMGLVCLSLSVPPYEMRKQMIAATLKVGR